MQAIFVERTAASRFHAASVENVAYLFYGLAAAVQLENINDNGRGRFVNLKIAIGIDLVPQYALTAQRLTFQGVFSHAARDLLRQFNAVIFRHAFKQAFHDDTFRRSVQVLHSRKNLHAVFLQAGFINCAVVAVAGEAVEAVHNDSLKLTLCAVLYHLLKGGAVVRLSADSAVDIGINYGYIIRFRKCITFP